MSSCAHSGSHRWSATTDQRQVILPTYLLTYCSSPDKPFKANPTTKGLVHVCGVECLRPQTVFCAYFICATVVRNSNTVFLYFFANYVHTHVLYKEIITLFFFLETLFKAIDRWQRCSCWGACLILLYSPSPLSEDTHLWLWVSSDLVGKGKKRHTLCWHRSIDLNSLSWNPEAWSLHRADMYIAALCKDTVPFNH